MMTLLEFDAENDRTGVDDSGSSSTDYLSKKTRSVVLEKFIVVGRL